MKKSSRLLTLLLIVSLLISMVPTAMAHTPVSKVDPPEIDTAYTTITSPSAFSLKKYFYVEDIYFQKVTFTAPKTGNYYFYQRRKDNCLPMIQVYTVDDDKLPIYQKIGTSGEALVMEAYLKLGYNYYVNFGFVMKDETYVTEKGIFIASCIPEDHMEAGASWTTTVQPQNGKSGKKVCYCDFCHQVGWTKIIPAIPWKLKIAHATYKSVKISWSKAEDATSYEVYYRKSSSSATPKLFTTTTKRSCTVTGLTFGKTYYFQVKAVTPHGTSDFSEMVSSPVTLKAPPKFRVTSPSVGKVKLTWKKVANAEGYIIYRSLSKNGKYSKSKIITNPATTSVTVSATKGKTYYYKIAAYRKVGSKKVPGTLSNYRQITVKK